MYNSFIFFSLSFFFSLFICLSPPLWANALVRSSYEPHQLSYFLKQQLEHSEEQNISTASNSISLFNIIQNIYKHNGYQLIWKKQSMIERLLSAVDDSVKLGLSPVDYHDQAIKYYLIRPQDDYYQQRVQADIIMTDAFLRLVYHMRFGKVIANKMDQHWNLRREFLSTEPAAPIPQALTSEYTLHQFFEQLTDLGVLYKALIMALGNYRAIEHNGGWQAIAKGKTIKPGMQDKRLPLIKQRLQKNGFLNDNDSTADNNDEHEHISKYTYNEFVVNAVKQFQASYNLRIDGIIGNDTLKQMNIPVTQRIEQIKVNLERVRWIKHHLEDEFVLVNIAGYKAYYVHNNKLLWKSKVQVGKNKRQSPILRDDIEYVVFNPTWTVPPTILLKDVLPAIKKDSSYLQKKNMKVVDFEGNIIDSTEIDWPAMQARNFPYMIRQDPGPSNALGRVKIMFPNEYYIYMHDTLNKRYFNKTDRAFSSGCIRVEKPFELVELLLKDNTKWNDSRFKKILASGKLKHVPLPEKVPVLILYFTALLDNNGHIAFFKDVYNRDKTIIEGLKQPFAFMIPKKLERLAIRAL